MSPTRETRQEKFDLAEPRPSAMIESLRAFGYNIQTAIADLIDNSISAGAKNIWLTFFWDGSDSYVSIRDDGHGMTEKELFNAMRPGSQNPLQDREPKDLGRFGLGLKTASFSQCRRLTVASRSKGCNVAIRRWDLDYVSQVDQWRLLHSAADDSSGKLTELDQMAEGTIVLWECMDRLVRNAQKSDLETHNHFLETIEGVEKHLSMVFHRFLEKRNRLKIWINGRAVEPWNPFLLESVATQSLPQEKFMWQKDKLVVQPYVLPHQSKIAPEIYNQAAGINGWNAQQGFYVYRNERLLVAGGWLGLGFKQEEHCKLARIQIDLPNAMDDDWNIDVKKSRACPPAALRSDLKRIARLTRQKAVEIYRHRGKVIARDNSDKHVFPWDRKIRRGKIFYSINHEHPLVKEALSLPAAHQPLIRSLIRLLEETVPVQQIWIDSSTDPEKHSQPFEYTPSREVVEVMVQVYQVLRKSGLSPQQVRDRILTMEPFQHFEALVQTLSDPLPGDAPV